MSSDKEAWLPVWRDKAGQPLACKEKLIVLDETFTELKEVAQDAFEDAVLVGCDEQQIRETMNALVNSLINPYKVQG